MPLPAHVTAQIRMVSSEGARASIILYYRNEGVDIDPANGPSVADAIFAGIDAPLAAVLPEQVLVEGVTIRVKGGPDDWEFMSTDAGVEGTSTADPLPEENAIVIQRRTGLPGRDKRGRVFIPFVPESFVSDSKLTGPALNAYKTLATRLGDKYIVTGVDLNPVQPSFKTNTLHAVREFRVYDEVCSRRDRRHVKRGGVFAAPNGTGIP